MNKQVVGAQRKILREQVFRTDAGLLAVGSCHKRIRSEDRWSNPGCRRNKWPALCSREKARCRASICHLLECLRTILFDSSRQVCENIPVEEDSIPRAKNPLGQGTPGDTNTRADVIRVLIEPGRQTLEIVTHAQINCQVACEGPMILYESADTRHRKIHVRIPERLSKLTRIPREEVAERAKEIYTIEAVRYVGTQSDAIHRSADLPKMFSMRARIHIAGLIEILPTFAVSRIGPPEGNKPSDINLRAERPICAQDRVARCGLKA